MPRARANARKGPELVWEGKGEGPFHGSAAKLLPLEVAGDAGGELFRSQLVRGENRAVMRAWMPRWEGRVDLVYIDPPVGTGGSFALSERVAGQGAGVEAYRDRLEPGLGDYLSAMLEQLTLIRALLSERGSVFLHCDWHVSHLLRCLLDEVFGADAFKNEIVWRYRRWPAKTRVFQRMHDVLFWYGKSADDGHAWTPSYEPLAASTLKTFGTKRQVADFSSGHRKPSQTEETTPGAPTSDVWDIGIIAPIARERVGYPTQKPEALLRRVIEATTRPGDLVADVFSGSGTSLVVAEKLGRRWLGCDVGRAAIHATRKRLYALGSASFEVAETADAEGARGRGGPAIEVTVRREGKAVELTLEGADLTLVDDWAVDWDYDGRVFRHGFHAARKTARDQAPVTARHVYADAASHGIAVRIADAAANETWVELA